MRSSLCPSSPRVPSASCATYSKVSEKRPLYNAPAGATGAVANANAEIVKALHLDRRDPLAALGEYMTAAETAWRQLQRNPQDEPARRDYNYAVGRVFSGIRREARCVDEAAHRAGEHGEYVLTSKPDPRPEWNPALYDFTPADQFDVGGRYVTERTTRDGIGAPIVAVEREHNKNAREFRASAFSTASPPSRASRAGAASCPPKIRSRRKPSRSTGTPFRSRRISPCRSRSCSADRSEEARTLARAEPGEIRAHRRDRASPALRPEQDRRARHPRADGFAGHLDADDQHAARRPGDPESITSSGSTATRAATRIRIPPPSCATNSTRSKSDSRRDKPMVVIGHSMGGCISRLLLTDSGDQLCLKIFGKPLDQVPLSPASRAYFPNELFFRHRPEIGRVIFIAAPLRGSDLASGWLAGLAEPHDPPPRLLQPGARCCASRASRKTN